MLRRSDIWASVLASRVNVSIWFERRGIVSSSMKRNLIRCDWQNILEKWNWKVEVSQVKLLREIFRGLCEIKKKNARIKVSMIKKDSFFSFPH